MKNLIAFLEWKHIKIKEFWIFESKSIQFMKVKFLTQKIWNKCKNNHIEIIKNKDF